MTGAGNWCLGGLIVIGLILMISTTGMGEYTNIRSARRMSKGCALWGQACLGGHFKKRNDEVMSDEMGEMANALAISAPFTPKVPFPEMAGRGTGEDYSTRDNQAYYPWNRNRFVVPWRPRLVGSRDME